jgi:pyrimidine operon attenuation protein/uracil phosphoribosyltransferase
LESAFAPPMTATQLKSQLMTDAEVDRTLVRLAHEVVTKNDSFERLVIVGIRRRGAVLAERLVAKIEQLENKRVPAGSLDINLYRDDLTTVAAQPVFSGAQLPFPLAGKDVILVDDVLYTGRTTHVALNALLDHGQPRTVQLLTLIDRGHRELPIEARFVGRFVSTTDNEIVEVKVQPIDGEDQVLLVERVDQG